MTRKSGPTDIKMSMFRIDSRRTIDHGYSETDYRLLCLVERGTVADFEKMQSLWTFALRARTRKAYSKGERIGFDKFGRELTVKEDAAAIEWFAKKLYGKPRGRRIIP